MTIEERVSAALREREQEIQSELRQAHSADEVDRLLTDLWEVSRQQAKIDLLGV
jgi:hypothetical protein